MLMFQAGMIARQRRADMLVNIIAILTMVIIFAWVALYLLDNIDSNSRRLDALEKKTGKKTKED